MIEQYQEKVGLRMQKKMIKEREDLKRNCPFTPKTNVSSFKNSKGEASTRSKLSGQYKNQKVCKSSLDNESDYLIGNSYNIKELSNTGVVLEINGSKEGIDTTNVK